MAFVLTPTDPSLNLTMVELTETPAAEREITAEQVSTSDAADRGSQVIYGAVDVRGVPVSDITVTLRGAAEETEGRRPSSASTTPTPSVPSSS
ncbi:hypothetical protein [Microbacterium sp. NIBRBAC000506063]|uniref:hypothetical protein n=1 Tax=Microbacterium sp. NIBRBAC000506063 TaxID=2734618 RepID=UPI001BB53700|nr:hypothetical protein [Microbacterium sp. NIBRBAC000506063]QTV80394.1 hypothetical protein KAE78_05540 [Microbacterium sp. NIBRBAC000506063]